MIFIRHKVMFYSHRHSHRAIQKRVWKWGTCICQFLRKQKEADERLLSDSFCLVCCLSYTTSIYTTYFQCPYYHFWHYSGYVRYNTYHLWSLVSTNSTNCLKYIQNLTAFCKIAKFLKQRHNFQYSFKSHNWKI